jgi:hypothetical protein
MDTAALVDRDLEIGRKILETLARAGIAVNVALWAHIPQISEWQLFIATPLVDTKGHRSAYDRVLRALQNSGINGDLPWRRIFLRSPKDPILKSLEKQSRAYTGEAVRVLNESIGDRFVEDAYIYSGSLHVVQLSKVSDKTPAKYSVIYTPYSGTGGAAPSLLFEATDNLRQFLLKKLLIGRLVVETAIMELSTTGNASIPNIQFNHAELKRVGLA